MLKHIALLTLMAISFAQAAAAQSPIARFLYEDAERAFAEQDYATTLTTLAEAEREFGSVNPPILYLRIQARHQKLLAAGARFDFDTLMHLRRESADYLTRFAEVDALRVQARDVYRISRELGALPTTRVEHASRLSAAGHHQAALDELATAEAETSGWSEPIAWQRIETLDRMMPLWPAQDPETARRLAQAIHTYRERAGDAAVTRDLAPIESVVLGLDAYLSAAEALATSHTQAFERFTAAAAQGSRPAVISLGSMHFYGHAVPQDIGRARELIRPHAEAGDPFAVYAMGRMAYEAPQPDHAAAREWFFKPILDDVPVAHLYRGALLAQGWGGPADDAAARRAFESAAAAGYRDAMTWLSLLNFEGRGGPRDGAAGVRWAEAGAAAGDPEAMNRLGFEYHRGQSVAQDYQRAVHWWRQAAELGHPPAQVSIGRAYMHGWGLSVDYAQAVVWLTKAAEAGRAEAMTDLANIYHSGAPNLRRDRGLSRQWRRQAAAAAPQ